MFEVHMKMHLFFFIFQSKSNKELAAFLFNDFLLLTTSNRPLTNTTHSLFDLTGQVQYKMYRTVSSFLLTTYYTVKLTLELSTQSAFRTSGRAQNSCYLTLFEPCLRGLQGLNSVWGVKVLNPVWKVKSLDPVER